MNIKEKKTEINKVINENVITQDINFIESPLFISSVKEIDTIESVNKKQTSSGVKRILKSFKKNYEKTPGKLNANKIPVVYKQYIDSKGILRELLILSAFPSLETKDVWFGLVGLYIQKIAPIYFDNENNIFDIKTDKMEFTLYELAKYMNKSTGGSSLNKLTDEILNLKNATYYSCSEGVFFDKQNNKYIKSKLDGISLVLECNIESEKRVKGEKVVSKCTIRFNSLIINNIRHQFFKYCNRDEYYSLPSKGYTRTLYSYIKANSYLSNGQMCKYIKRNLEILRNKLPIYYHQPSKIKEKLKSPLKNLIKRGIVSDYFYGDEVLINGKKEYCIYIIINSNYKKEDIINQLNNKQLKNITIDNEKNTNSLIIPEDLKEYLKNKGFTEKRLCKFLNEYNKWEIIKYSLWLEVKEKENKNNVNNFSGLLDFALKAKIGLEEKYKYIEEFINNEKQKYEKKLIEEKSTTEDKYRKYIEREIRKFKKEDSGAYNILIDMIIADLDNKYDNAQLNFKNFDKYVTDDEQGKWKQQQQKWDDYAKNKVNSDIFREFLIKSICDIRGLKTFSEFSIS